MAGVEGRCSCARLDQACRAGINKFQNACSQDESSKNAHSQGSWEYIFGGLGLESPKKGTLKPKAYSKGEQLGVHILEVSRLAQDASFQAIWALMGEKLETQNAYSQAMWALMGGAVGSTHFGSLGP